ncbi:DEAD/DEAH box helicase [Archaeoglobus profundus]|uniref:Transcriptional regulator, XRE family n=1 Tax=Archaeoglobus profundus (strain DSM 5631 / JCM 9629 / NBRC 100127 / Av18) TaxID=572546 RepID=D2RF09_ARCPA|nr:DEAD/DEAH box helicase [Archaeoglobus profundus]ADB58703.1 transcriptional regulator, XRE family [Archaeoglobus profundus DSM 5631]
MIVKGRAYSDDEILSRLNWIVAEWFKRRFKTFTPPQRYSIVPALEGKNVLVTSPTGSGKTLAGFLPIISDLVSLAEKGKLEDAVYAVYVSPLRALNNDIRRNLEVPLKEIYELAKEKGVDLQEIRIAVRTGDTTPEERAKQLRKPPHILITTPETLAIVLSTPKFSQYLKGVRYLIVDEIHALAENKRGTHLTLSIERLEELQEGRMVRIGLSATIHPLDEVARFLVGYENGRERDCIVADVTFEKKMDIKVISPIEDFFATSAEEISEKLYKTIAEMIKKCRTALIFTNTRSATERVVYHLKKLLPDYPIKAHHSSLSREVRLEVEEELKKGKLRAVVCVAPNTKIVTERGFVDIKNLKNEKILGLKDFRTTLVNFKEPLKVECRKGYRIRTKLGFEIECTPEHRFLTLDNGLVWKEAKDFKVGDFVAVVRKIRLEAKEISILNYLPNNAYIELRRDFLDKLRTLAKSFGLKKTAKILGVSASQLAKSLRGEYPIRFEVLKKLCEIFNVEIEDNAIEAIRSDKNKAKIRTTKFTKAMARLLGFWLSDGSWTSKALRFYSNDLEMLEKYAKIVEEEFDLKVKIRRDRHLYRFDLSFCVLFEIFKGLLGSMSKKSKFGDFPEIIYTLPDEHKIEFLSGYFDGDGYFEVRNGRIYSASFTTFSKNFAEGLRNLLLHFGIVSSIRVRNYDEIQIFRGREIKKRGKCYTVTVLGGEYLRKFLKILKPYRVIRYRGYRVGDGYCNRDVFPNIGKVLRNIRCKLGLSTYRVQKELGYNPVRVESGKKNISRRNLIKLLKYYQRFGNLNEIDYLLDLARGDIFFDRIVRIEQIDFEEAYGIINSETENYIVNGFISKNSSTSLELGIDIGYIDLVILIGSPKSINRALQRIGRAGHRLEDVSVGRIVVVDQDDLVECTVLVREALSRRLDRIHIPKKPLDVLCQHIIGMALERKWKVDEAFRLVKRAYPYKDLTMEEFLDVLNYLSGRFSELEEEKVYGKIWFDGKEFGKRSRLLRPIYYLNVGTIPDEVAISVVTKDGKFIGKVEEEFAERLVEGDVFVLAGRTFRYLYSRGMSIIVEEVEGVKPTIPSWFSEQLPLSYDLALRIQEFRGFIEKNIENPEFVIEHLMKIYNLDYKSAKAIYNYFYEQEEFSKIPTNERLLIEIFSEDGYYYHVFHTLVGRRANDAISRVFAYRIGRERRCNVGISLTDNGFMLKLPFKLSEDEIKALFSLENFREDLIASLDKTELLRRRFRHVAVRSFMILRNYMGKEKSVYRQQISADNLLRLLKKKYPSFPVLRETYREIVEDYMDIENALDYLRRVADGRVKVEILELPMVSPFALNMYLAGREDVVLMADRREVLRKLHEMILKRISSKYQ